MTVCAAEAHMEKKPTKDHRSDQSGKLEPDSDPQNLPDRLQSKYNTILTEPVPKRLRDLVERLRRAKGGNKEE